VHFTVGHALLPADQLVELPVDVVFFRDHALFDLYDFVAALAQLGFEISAELIACSRASMPASRRVTSASPLRLVEKQVPLAAGTASRLEPATSRSATNVAGDSGDECDHDCTNDEHGRSYGLVARTTHIRRLALPTPPAASAAGAPYRSQVRVFG